jgi:hypothetical protein
LSDLVARWDGAVQSAGPTHGCLLYQRCTINTNGSIRALSLHVMLRSAADVEQYDGQGGVQLLQVMKADNLVDIAPTELFQDPARDQLAVHAALRELVLTPEQIQREDHPQTKAH